METFGLHLIVEFMGCDYNMLNDESIIVQAMRGAAEHAGCTILDVSSRRFDPQGITAFVVVAESHLSIHSWPEHGYAALDIFTCGNHVMPMEAYKYLKHKLKPKDVYVKKIKRGMHY